MEGTTNSLDTPLYDALFPDLSVIPKGSCIDVQRAVSGLRGSQDLHHVEAFGLIDRDDRPDEEIDQLAEDSESSPWTYARQKLSTIVRTPLRPSHADRQSPWGATPTN